MDIRAIIDPRTVIAAPGSDYDEYLGSRFTLVDKEYMVVQAAANIASAAKLILGGGVNYAVNFPTNDGDPVVGQVPSDIVTVSGTANQIDQSSVFCVITRGSVVTTKSTAESFAAAARLEVASTGLVTAHAAASSSTVIGLAGAAAAASITSVSTYISF